MKKRIIVPVVVFALLVVTAGIVNAATERNITKKLGGNKGDQFTLNGLLFVSQLKVNKTTQFNGAVTIGGKPVPTKTLYKGVFDVTQDGDQVATWGPTGSSDLCNAVPTATRTTEYHYKKIAVSGLRMTAIPDIKVSIQIDSTHMAGPYPNISNSWVGGSYVLADGYAYVMYKMVSVACSGTETPTYYTNGNYQILVVN
jgi:hypothetical protein